MKEQLEAIAKRFFGFPTLKERKSDTLDFRVVAVWNVEAALTAAYEAGKAAVEKK